MTLFSEEFDAKREHKPQSFSDRVVALALTIPPGRVTTYGALARAAGGGRMAAQSVTAALGAAWDRGEKKIPFHRIVYSDGRVWITRAAKKQRLALYKKEGIEIDRKNRIIDFESKLHEL